MANVLVAVSDAALRERLGKTLSGLKHTVVSVATMDEALEKLQRAKFDVFFCDPVLSGQVRGDFFSELSKRFSGIPIVATMSLPDVDLAVSLLSDGASECVSPPFSEEELSSVVKKVMGQIGYYHLKRGRDVKRAKPFVFWSLTTALFLIGLGGSYIFNLQKSKSQSVYQKDSSTFIIPLGHTTGLTYKQNSLWISDWYEQKVYKYTVEKGLQKVAEYYFPDYQPTSVAATDNALWTTGNDRTLRKHSYDANLTVEATYDVPMESSISGLGWDGHNLWACDIMAKKIYRFQPAEKLILEETVSYTDIEPVGLVIEGRTLWVADAKSSQLLRAEINDGTLLVTKRYTLKPFAVAGNKFGGVASDGRHVWVISENTGILYYEDWKNIK